MSKRTRRFAGENLANARRAAKAWTNVSDALDTAIDRTQHVAGGTRSKLRGVQGETLRRGKAARDALAGKRPWSRGPWISGALAVGCMIGAASTLAARRLSEVRERAQAEDAAAAVAADLARAEFAEEMAAGARAAGPKSEPGDGGRSGRTSGSKDQPTTAAAGKAPASKSQPTTAAPGAVSAESPRPSTQPARTEPAQHSAMENRQ